MRESAKAALGGIIAALSVSIMLITYISPVLVYTAPVFAGMFLLIIVEEIGYRWALGTFAAVSLLSVFMIADKEAAVFYTMLFGYYPILREFICGKLTRKTLLFFIKLIIFNSALFSAIAICATLQSELMQPFDTIMPICANGLFSISQERTTFHAP